jgi:hypothetical protein
MTPVYTPKYGTLAALKSYGRISQPGQADISTDDSILLYQLARADCAIDHYCGTDFAHQTNTLEMARNVWVDRNGWIQCQVHKPIVTASTIAMQIMMVANGATTWTPLTLSQCICISDISNGDAPRPQAWTFMAYPNIKIAPTTFGNILAQVTYTSGYSTIPAQLTAINVRLAWFYYKLREAPMMKIDTLNLGVVEIPVDMPKDIRGELSTWRRPIQ